VTGVPADPPKSSNQLAEERTALAGDRTHLAEQRSNLADERTRLAFTRTILAIDRTLMAWVRTAVSLISFGFTIYKFFNEVERSGPPGLMTPRAVALVMIGLGVGSLAIATLEHRSQAANLRSEYKMDGSRRSLAASLASVIAALGVLGFVLVLLRQ
jgi:putative membrane protein